MPPTLEALAARLQALEDREAIRDLIASYGPLADTGAADALSHLWTEDGRYAVGGMTEAKGRAAIAALIDGAVHRGLMADGCAHALGPVTIDLDGDTATARGYSVVLRADGTGGWTAHRVSANRWHLARTPDGWRVTARENALLDGTDAARALLATA
jgi:uncharacterized protein (TIGR02246 family)